MARPYWSGQIKISLVSFGVKLFAATEARSEIHFHLIDRNTGERVKHQNVPSSAIESAPGEAAEPVETSDIVKGYEYARGRYVTIEPEEIAHLRVPSRHTMEVTQFVDESAIDPEFFEKPYFVVPEDDAQTESFLTVRKALIDTKKVALSRIAFAGREHVVAIAPAGTDAHPGLMAYTMRFAAEIRDPAEYFHPIKKLPISADSLSLARELIQRKAAKFDPSKFVDGYEVALKELVEAKLKHAPIPKDELPARPRGKVINLMDALRKSVSSGAKEEKQKEIPKHTARKSESRQGPTLVKGVRATKSATKKRKSA